MPQTNAELQAAFRRRRDERMALLTSRLAATEATIARQGAEITRLERERDALYAVLDSTEATFSRPVGQTPDCPHPAAMVDGDRCGGCGQSVDAW